MSLLNRFVKLLLLGWFSVGVGVGFLVVYPALYFTLRKPEWYYTANRIRAGWLSWCLFWGGVKVERVFEQPLNKHTYVITPNHTSKLDMIVLTSKLGMYFNYAADRRFRRIPLFGRFFRTIDLPVDLEDPRGAAIAYKKALIQLGEGRNLAVFPEGTIARITPQLSSFKEGAFRMAIEKQVDVLPVTLIGGWRVLPDDGPLGFSPGKVTLYVHAPVSTKGMHVRQAKQMAQQVSAIIENKLREYGEIH